MAAGSRAKSRVSKSEQARSTRRKVVAAASDLFVREGFLSTTMAAIAAEAGVAVQTLYLGFGSKTAILAAAFDTALAGDDEPVPLSERPWFVEVLAAEDGPVALERFVRASAEIIGRSTPLYAVIRAAAADPEVAEILARNKQERHEVFTTVARALAEKEGFDRSLSVDDAAGILYTLQSEESHALLVTEHGWTGERWSGWVLDTLRAQLFPTADSAGPDLAR